MDTAAQSELIGGLSRQTSRRISKLIIVLALSLSLSLCSVLSVFEARASVCDWPAQQSDSKKPVKARRKLRRKASRDR